MSAAPAKLRADLKVTAHRTGTGTFYVLKDPIAGTYYRLKEAEEFIARQFDGDTPLEVIRSRVRENFGADLAPETLEAFAKNLEKTGLLEGDRARIRRPSQAGRVRGSLLYLRYKALDPEGLLTWLEPKVGFLFSPAFISIAVALMLVAAAIMVFNAGAVVQEVKGLYQLSTIPLFLFLSFLTITAHEFGHGLACKRFGGEVREIGFMLIYFQPAMYCNVSDAWLFPEKSKRLLVGLAGPFVELTIWAIAVLTWRMTEPGTWLGQSALIIAASSGIKTFFNFNPLLKYDGYYLLSDYLEIPNLRKKSFRYAGYLLGKIFGFEYAPPEGESRRVKRIYFLYGFTALAGSLGLLASLLMIALGHVADGSQPTAIAIAIVAYVALRMWRWVRRLFGGSASADDDEEEDTAESSSKRASRRSRSRTRPWALWVRRLAWLTVLGGLVAAAFLTQSELRIAGAFRILPVRHSDIRAAQDGIVERILVDEGDRVQAGDVIARLSDRELSASLQKTVAEIREIRARMNMLEAGPTTHEIKVVEAGVQRASGNQQIARARLERGDMLLREGVLARNKYDDLRDEAASAEAELREAKARYDAIVNSVRPEQIESTAAQLQSLETQKENIESQLSRLDVVAPVAGVVGTPSRTLRQMPGHLVKKGDLVATVYDFQTVTAELAVSEREIADVKPGQTIELKARAHPDLAFHGKVDYIATSAGSASAADAAGMATLPTPGPAGHAPSVVLVMTKIDNKALLLKPEMTGQAKIFGGQQRIVDLMVRRIARTFRVEFWSWW